MNKISLKIFLATHAQLDSVKYQFGAKPPFLSAPLDALRVLDCSAYARIQLFHATSGALVIPDGSVNQREWCEKEGLHQLKKYSDVQYAITDKSRLFICFVKPFAGVAGHVWFVRGGRTYESRGGAGVSSRGWNLTFAKLRNAVAFELPTES
jgi:hypothetical protein